MNKKDKWQESPLCEVSFTNKQFHEVQINYGAFRLVWKKANWTEQVCQKTRVCGSLFVVWNRTEFLNKFIGWTTEYKQLIK